MDRPAAVIALLLLLCCSLTSDAGNPPELDPRQSRVLLEQLGSDPSPRPRSSFQPRLRNMATWNYSIETHPEHTSTRFWTDEMLQHANMLGASSYLQLRPVLAKLHRGRPLTVAAFGTSITESAGCWHRSMEQLEGSVGALRLSREDMEGRCTGSSRGYLSTFMRVLNDTFPHPDHLLVNNAMPGSTPAHYLNWFCLEFYVPRRPDLVIIEQVGGG